MSKCVDAEALDLAARVGRALHGLCDAAAVLLSTRCPHEEHGSHVSVAVVGTDATIPPRVARHLVKQMRKVADDLEQKFCPPGSSN